MGYYAIWDFGGPNAGHFVEAASQAEVDAAEQAATPWGQDARKWTGLQLLPVGTAVPGPLDPDAPPPDDPPPPPPPPPPAPEPCPDPHDKPAPADDADDDATASYVAPAPVPPAKKGMQAGENYATRHVESAPRKRGRPRKAA